MSSWNLTECSKEVKVLSNDGVSSLLSFDLSLFFLSPSLTDFFGAIRIQGVRVFNWEFWECDSFKSDWE